MGDKSIKKPEKKKKKVDIKTSAAPIVIKSVVKQPEVVKKKKEK